MLYKLKSVVVPFFVGLFLLGSVLLFASEISRGGGVFLLLCFAVIICVLIYVWGRYSDLYKKYDFLQLGMNALPQGIFVLNSANQLVFKNVAYDHFVDGAKSQKLDMALSSLVKKVREDGFVQSSLSISNTKTGSPSSLYQMTAVALMEDFSSFIFSVMSLSQAEGEPHSRGLTTTQLLDKSPVGVFSINSLGECLYMNKVVEGWFNCSSSKRVNLFKVLDVADDMHSFFPEAAQINTGKVYEHYFSVRKQFYRVFQRFVLLDSGEYVTCSIIFKSKRNRQSMVLDSENFKTAFEEAPTGIVLIDEKRNILAVNQKYSLMLQKAPDDLTGRSFDLFLNFSCKQKVLEAINKTLVKGGAQKVVDVSLKGGKHDNLAAYISTLTEGGKTIGSIIHFVSEEEQKRMEVQFVHSQRMQAVGQLAGGVAHDFNNLLTAMIGFCDLLLQRHSPAEQSFSDIMQIKQNANRAAGLVRQLLAFSRQQSLQPQVINITDALSELSALFRRLLGPAIDLKVKHSRDLWFIKVDKGQFEQVVINLAVNARDAMENSGVLKITTSNFLNKKNFVQNHDSMPPGEYVSIDIEDTGCGITPDIVGRIFEPFFSTKSVGSGTGLGLSTVYGIVRQTGGFIFVDSTVGRGSMFRIFFPRHMPKEEEYVKMEEKQLSDLTGTANILLVEDEEAVRMFAARALKDKGYNVIEAANGIDAVETVKNSEESIDLIITDVVMPGMDGPQMINEVRQILPEVKVVFISGYAEDSFRKKLNNEDNIHFLPKPFNLKDLALKVKDILN